ncbi:retrovirus-related pol polyprotein from transposon TNT 1-94 [Tanacetum coccineum]
MNLNTSEERHIKEPIWYLDSGCSRSMTGVKSYLHKYVDQDILLSLKPSESLTLGDNKLRKLIMLPLMRAWKPSEDQSRQYQANSDISYYNTPHNHSLTELIKTTHVPEVITPNEQNIPHSEETEGPPDLINTKGTQEQIVQNDHNISQPTKEQLKNNTETSVSITKHLVSEVTQHPITHYASTSSNHVPHDRWSRDQHIKLMNIINEPTKGMLIRSMVSKLTAASTSECLFVDFLFEIEPKKVLEALKHPGWVYKNKKDEHGIVNKNKARLAAQGYSQVNKKELTMMKTLHHVFLNGKLKEEVYVKQPPGFESSEFPNYVCKLDKSLYRLKQTPWACVSVKTPMVPPNNLDPDLSSKPMNETLYRGMIGSLMYLTTSRPDIQLSICLWARYHSNPKESRLIAMKRISKYLKGTPTLVAMSSIEARYVDAAGCCVNILWTKSQLTDYEIQYKMVPIFCDNTNAIAISNNHVLYSRTKHNDIRYHFIRDHILKGDIELHFIPTEYQLADIFIKLLDEPLLLD